MKAREFLKTLPNGTVFSYNKRRYFISNGLEARIFTDTNGHWYFLDANTYPSRYSPIAKTADKEKIKVISNPSVDEN